MQPTAFEAVLSQVSIFGALRVDEIGRVARKFEIFEIDAKSPIDLAATADAARLVVVARGQIDLSVTSPAGTLESTLEPGDRFGEMQILSCVHQGVRLSTKTSAVVATLDRSGLDRILEEFPVVALSLATELATEQSAKNDLARQLMELHAEGLEGEE
ncbi:MAG: cyclic nucleotide-binding domain-containing protein, partial [Polyangiaceae bacterium]